MTELMPYRPTAALENYQDVAIHRLAEWANSADAAHRIASTLVQTSFCPDQFRNKPGEATAAILAGLEVGLQPMAALRSFDIINNQAAPRAITLRAIVQSFGHELVLEESTATRCKMKGRRQGSSEWQGVTWTIERARQLGLVSKSNWRNQPQAMLVARATSELARLIASDAILGIGYSSEEIADGGSYDEQVTVETTAPAATSGSRRMSRVGRIAEDQVEDVDLPEESPFLNTSSALAKRMFATLNDAGITDKDDRLAFCSAVTARTITTSSELTDADAERIIAEAQRSMASDDGPSYDEPDISANDPSLDGV